MKIAVILTLLVALVMAKHQEKKPHPEDLIPNDRGIKISNRDFTNMIQYGLIDGMFKYKMGGLPDCT